MRISSYSDRKTNVFRLLTVLVLGMSIMVSGCSVTKREPEPKTPSVTPAPKPSDPSFTPSGTTQVEGEVWSVNPDQTISPDGKYVLFTRNASDGMAMLALPIGDAVGKPVVLHSADRAWTSGHTFGYYPLGWTSGTTCLFLVHGNIDSGPNKGKTGVAIYRANLSEASSVLSQEVGFIPLPNGSLTAGNFFPGRGRALLYVTGAMWEYDALKSSLRCVTASLPVDDKYLGFFYPKPSPDGTRLVYDLWGDAPGIYVMDVLSGQQRRLVKPGDTTSFYPFWSPDGKYIAAYTVNRKQSAGQRTAKPPASDDLRNYNIIYGEEGPLAAGQAITVFSLDGKVVQTIAIKDKWLRTFKWGADSLTLGFVAGLVSGEPDMPDIDPQSFWLCKLGERPVQVDEVVPAEDGDSVYAAVAAVDKDGQGIIYNDYRSDEITLRHARLGVQAPSPASIPGDITGWDVESDHVMGHPMVGVVQSTDATSAWAFAPGKWVEIHKYDSNRSVLIIGYRDGLLVIADSPLINWYGYKAGTKLENASVSVFRFTENPSGK